MSSIWYFLVLSAFATTMADLAVPKAKQGTGGTLKAPPVGAVQETLPQAATQLNAAEPQASQLNEDGPRLPPAGSAPQPQQHLPRTAPAASSPKAKEDVANAAEAPKLAASTDNVGNSPDGAEEEQGQDSSDEGSSEEAGPQDEGDGEEKAQKRPQPKAVEKSEQELAEESGDLEVVHVAPPLQEVAEPSHSLMIVPALAALVSLAGILSQIYCKIFRREKKAAAPQSTQQWDDLDFEDLEMELDSPTAAQQKTVAAPVARKMVQSHEDVEASTNGCDAGWGDDSWDADGWDDIEDCETQPAQSEVCAEMVAQPLAPVKGKAD